MLVALTVQAATAQENDSASQQPQAEGEGDDQIVRVDEEIIVSGTPVERELFVNPAQVTAIGGDEKRALQTSNLGTTIDQLAGVSSINTGSQVGKPVIRGLSLNRIRVLTNDVGLNFQQYGVRHPVNIDPYTADRIEIVRGAASVQYGSDAIGGVVNVINDQPYFGTDAPTELSGVGTLEYSTGFQEITTALELEATSGPWGADGTFVFRNSEGMEVPDAPTALETGNPTDPLVTGATPFTDFEQLNGAFAVGRATSWGGVSIRWEGWRADQNFLVPDPPPPNGNPLQGGGLGQRLENDIVQLRADTDLGTTLRLRTSFTYVRNLRQANAGPPEPVPLPANEDTAVIDIRRDSLTARAVLNHGLVFGLIQGQVGVQLDQEFQTSRGPTALNPGGTVQNFAAFVFEEYKTGPLTVDVGLRIDHRRTEADPDETANDIGLPGFSTDPDLPDDPSLLEQSYTVATGGVGVSYQLTDSFVLAANANSGFRAPSLFDLFVNGVHGGVAAIQLGDPTLDPERSLNTDLTARYRSDLLQVEAAIYRNQINNFIFPGGTGRLDEESGNPIFQLQQDDAVLIGGDIDLTLTPTDWFEGRLTYERVEGDLDQNDTDVPLLPSDKLTGALTVTPPSLGFAGDPFLSASVTHGFEKDAAGLLEPFGQFDAPPPPFGTGSTDAYTIVDLSAGFTTGPVDFRVEVTNLLDEEYRDFLDTYKNITLSPGRDVRLRLSAGF
jgi:iron complex outermembrane receptor protein/hemoglobin/transferrin/lactoferrin receptor protein